MLLLNDAKSPCVSTSKIHLRVLTENICDMWKLFITEDRISLMQKIGIAFEK